MTEILYDLFLTLSFSIGAFLSFDRLVFEKNYDFKGLLFFAAIAVLAVIFKNLKAKAKILLSGICVFVLALLYFFFSRGLIFSKGDYGFDFFLKPWLFLIFVIAAIAATRYKSVRLVLALGVPVSFCIQMLFLRNPSPLEFSLCIIFVVMVIVERLNVNVEKKDYKRYIVFLWPFFLVLFLLLSRIKPSAKPYDWKEFVNMYERASEFVREVSDRLFHSDEEEYSISTIDFSPESGFGKNRKGLEKRLMELKSNLYSGDYIYLAGSHFDRFDGQKWTMSEGREESAFEALEVMNAARRNSETKSLRDYCAIRNVDVRFLSFSTQFVFVPEKPLYFTMEDGMRPMAFERGSMMFDEKVGFGTEYRVSYVNENRNTEAILSVLGSGIPFSREILESDIDIYFRGYEDRLSYDNYLKYKDNVYKKYLDKTEYSKRVKNFIREIYESADNDFERLLLLEKKLRGLKYTLSPKEIPASVKSKEEYLDFWLFESGEGYCTHFATAFTLMAREMGIPTRYVQGYRVEVTDDELSIVKNNFAHAYAEAYIDGFGFVSFEPTPGYRMFSTWSVAKPSSGESTGAIDNRPSGENTSMVDTDESIYQDDDYSENYGKKHVNIYVFFVIAGVIIWFVAIFFLVSFIYSLRKVKKLEGQEKTFALCRVCMKILYFIGCRKRKEETLSEFYLAHKADVSKTCLSFIEVYERLLYGCVPISKSDAETVNEAYGRLLICLKEEKKLLYPFYLYLCLGEV